MFFGRNEECGLRCVYHGWKFDVDGNCVDLPSEPATTICRRRSRPQPIRASSAAGWCGPIWGRLNIGPDFPDLEWAHMPDSHRYATRHIQECNWLQGLEGEFDSSHLSFLHGGCRAYRDARRSDALRSGADGFRLRRRLRPRHGEEGVFWAANVMLMPFHKIIASTPMAAHVWAPMDDENTMLYSIDFNPTRPLTEEDLARSKAYRGIHTENIPGTDRAYQNRGNDYLIDRELQANGGSFTGMRGLGIQDCAIQESMGPIADRTLEHLGISDTAISRIRRLLLQALKDHAAGKPLPGANPRSWRVRSARYKASPGASFAATMEPHVRIDNLVPAE